MSVSVRFDWKYAYGCYGRSGIGLLVQLQCLIATEHRLSNSFEVLKIFAGGACVL